MSFVAWRMLTGDRAKYLGLIFAIAFSTFLLENQASIFAAGHSCALHRCPPFSGEGTEPDGFHPRQASGGDLG